MTRLIETLEHHDDFYLLENPEGNEPDAETALWRAVITQALMDAGSTSGKAQMRYDRAQAIAWLSGTTDDFHEVCTRAHLHPDYVRKKAKEAIHRGCGWRKGMKFRTLPPTRNSSLPAPAAAEEKALQLA